MFWELNNQVSLLFSNIPYNDSFILILALFCWFGTVYVFSVPLYHIIFDKNKEDKIRAVKILGLLVCVFFTILVLVIYEILSRSLKMVIKE